VQRDLLRYSLLHSLSILLAYLTLLELPPYVCCAPRKLGLSLSFSLSFSLSLSLSRPLPLSSSLSFSLSLRFTSRVFFRCLPHWARRDQEPSCVPFVHFLALVVSLSIPVDHATPTKAKRDANTGPTNAELFLSWRPLVSDLASAAWRVSPWTNERFERVFICARVRACARARTRDFCGKIGRSFLTTPARLINVRYLRAA